jgi:hypothetical protein
MAIHDRTRFTQYDVDSFEHRGQGNGQQFLWEKGNGFGVGVPPTQTKSYFVSGQIVGKNKTRRKAIGRVDEFDDIRKARIKAQAYFNQMQDGIDPFETEEEKRGKTIRAAIEDKIREMRKRNKRPISIRDYTANLNLYMSEFYKSYYVIDSEGKKQKKELILESWMERPLFDIKASEIIERHKAIGVPTPPMADSVFRALRAVFTLQIDNWDDHALGSKPSNTVAVALKGKWFPAPEDIRILERHEITELLQILKKWDRNPTVPPFIRIMLFTGLS